MNLLARAAGSKICNSQNRPQPHKGRFRTPSFFHTPMAQFLIRVRHFIRGLFSSSVRDRTVEIQDLVDAAAALSHDKQRLEMDVQQRDQQIRELQSTVKVQTLEINELVGVIERNRRRVEAETAIEANKIARATFDARAIVTGGG